MKRVVAVTTLERILVVDDDSAILTLAEMALSQLGGFQVKTTTSGEDAIACLGDFNPDMILLDANMPGLDGPETLEKIRQHPQYSSLPIAFVTGETRQTEVDQLMALGAIGVINKPYDPMTLSEQVRQLGSANE